MFYIGIDLGGTNIAAGLTEDEKVVCKTSTPTCAQRPIEEIIADMAEAAKKCAAEGGVSINDVEWIGVGCPGTVNSRTGVVEYSNNIKMKDVPMRDMLSSLLGGKKVFIENDANAAAWGEYCAGAAKGAESAVAVTLGTGVGSGIILDGKLLTGANFAGGELGHTVIEVGGRPCTCGRKGCWEAYASATGLINLTKEAMESSPSTYMWKLCGGDISRVGGKTAFDAMRAGDELGKKTVNRYIEYLGCGIVNIINAFQPDVVTISGGISREGEYLTQPLQKIIESERYSKYCSKQTKVTVASLGTDAGIIGAALLGRQSG